MDLQNTVKEALNALYHHPDDAVRMQADRYLQDFQRTLDAWQVQRDFEELPSTAFRPLRDSLNVSEGLCIVGAIPRISIAVAALAVHVPAEDWGDGGIVKWLRDEMDSHPEYIPGFLELLTVLPEEVLNYKIAARPERRRQFEKELTSQMEVALNILTACLSISELKEQWSYGDVFMLNGQVLEAFASWLRLKHGIPGSVLSSHPLVLTALSSLNSELLSEASVNVISELIHYTTAGDIDVSANMPLIQVIVPHVMNLKAQLSDSTKDEEDVKAIARLFADMGDSYVELIATAERNRRLHVFRPAYESLVSLVIFRVQYPEDYQDLSYEDLKEFKQTKYAVADVLTDASSVLGGDATLKILYMKLLEAVSGHGNNEHKEWRPAEAALFCIRAISNYVSVVEAEVMPQIMALLPKLPHQPQLLQTVCLTIGAYSKWLDSASCGLSVLPSVLDILMNGMGTSEECAAAAALAFRHICDDCRKKLCGCLEGLFHIYNKTVNGEDSFKVPAEDSLHLVEALSMVVTELPPDDAKRALEALCIPVITPLQEAINQGPESLSKRPSRQLTVHIDRFAYIFSLLACLRHVYDDIDASRAWDMRTMESLCRACKYAVRTSGRFMGLTIGAMLEEIQSLYRQHHQPCFLYLSSEVIKIFGSDPSCADYLKNLIEALFQHTTLLLTNIQEFTARPDIADDCFLLASREASNSILHFLADIFDLANSSVGEQFIPIRDSVIIPRGASITRILVASLTGALPKSRVDVVSYTLLALTRSYGMQALEWAKKSVLLIPSTAVTDVERSRFLKALSDAASGGDTNGLTVPVEELSDVCRRNRAVQEIVQEALRPLELNMVNVS
ncbi:hypothetical protein JHK82_011664 [Glycine max]|nr:hypothetical protein JHK82_011664 [Glycine max]